MPELPEVETMVRGIRAACQNRVIERLEFVRSERRPIQILPGRREVLRSVRGKSITKIERLAKRVVLQLDSASLIVVEPRMTGLLLVTKPPTAEHRRVVWHFRHEGSKSDRLEFWDRRGLGTLSVYSTEQFEQLRARLGPDALEIDVTGWRSRLKATSRAIKVALLDQQLVAGIGNLYASEILHLAGISPLRSATKLTARQIQRLADATQQILTAAIRCEGSTLKDGTYRNALSEDGSYQNHHSVYQCGGKTCSSCGKAPIQRIVQAQRATFYCPRCQR
jgi:formamidopyrimidine-DNA glycosylase